MSTDRRWLLWTLVAQSVRQSFPDRAPALLCAVEARLEPGPWSVEVSPTDAREGWTTDRVLTEVGRAMRAATPDTADEALRDLERWFLDSARLAVQPILEDAIVRGAAHDRVAIAEWAIRALEVGLDSPSLRILAGLRDDESHFEVDAWFARTLRELGLEAPRRATLRSVVLRMAREITRGELDPFRARQWAWNLYYDAQGDVRAELATWRDLHLQWLSEHAGEEILAAGSAIDREVMASARAMLGAPEHE